MPSNRRAHINLISPLAIHNDGRTFREFVSPQAAGRRSSPFEGPVTKEWTSYRGTHTDWTAVPKKEFENRGVDIQRLAFDSEADVEKLQASVAKNGELQMQIVLAQEFLDQHGGQQYDALSKRLLYFQRENDTLVVACENAKSLLEKLEQRLDEVNRRNAILEKMVPKPVTTEICISVTELNCEEEVVSLEDIAVQCTEERAAAPAFQQESEEPTLDSLPEVVEPQPEEVVQEKKPLLIPELSDTRLSKTNTEILHTAEELRQLSMDIEEVERVQLAAIGAKADMMNDEEEKQVTEANDNKKRDEVPVKNRADHSPTKATGQSCACVIA